MAGDVNFSWDGQMANGQRTSEGTYYFLAEANVDTKIQQLSTNMSANVDSVMLNGSNGLQLNVAGIGSIAFDQVKQISE